MRPCTAPFSPQRSGLLASIEFAVPPPSKASAKTVLKTEKQLSSTSSTLLTAGAAALLAAPAAFGLLALPSSSEARVAPRIVNHYIRQTRLPGAQPGTYRSGLWVLNPATGRVRLCVVAERGTATEKVLQCSPWAGGGEPTGRYQITDIRGQYQLSTTRRVWGVIGVWVLNYRTGQVRACLIQDFAQPTASLRCSELQ